MYNNEKFEEMTSYIKNREVKTKLSHRNEDPQWFEGKLIHNIKVITVRVFDSGIKNTGTPLIRRFLLGRISN